jgi:hypothetical protein
MRLFLKFKLVMLCLKNAAINRWKIGNKAFTMFHQIAGIVLLRAAAIAESEYQFLG